MKPSNPYYSFRFPKGEKWNSAYNCINRKTTFGLWDQAKRNLAFKFMWKLVRPNTTLRQRMHDKF